MTTPVPHSGAERSGGPPARSRTTVGPASSGAERHLGRPAQAKGVVRSGPTMAGGSRRAEHLLDPYPLPVLADETGSRDKSEKVPGPYNQQRSAVSGASSRREVSRSP
jgi:hypothetical protein